MRLENKKKIGRQRRERFEKKMIKTRPQASIKRRTVNKKSPGGSPGLPAFLAAMLWIGFSGTVAYMLLFSPVLLVTGVNADGGTESARLHAEQYIQSRLAGTYFGILPKANYFLISPKRLAADLQDTYPLFRAVTMRRVFPDRIQANIELRPKVVLWCSGGPCYLINEEGYALKSDAVFASEENRRDALLITDMSGQPVRLGQRLFDFDMAGFAAALSSSFRDELGLHIADEYSASSRFADEIRVRTDEGFEVYLNTRLPLEESLGLLRLLLTKELPEEQRAKLRYVDLRTEKKAFYAFEGEEPDQGVSEPAQAAPPGTDASAKNGKKKKTGD